MSGDIARILVALDATAETGAAIAAAVGLAARARTPLHAVFVEDEDLLSLAGLPVARQVITGAAAAPLTTADVELQLRAAAARAQQSILAAARERSLDCTFEIVRGGAETALSIAAEGDLVVAGASARPVARHFRVESLWSQALDRMPGRLLLARPSRNEDGRGVVVLLRGRGSAAERLLAAAAQIAELSGRPLTVIGPPGHVGAENVAEWVAARLAPAMVGGQIEMAPADPAALRARLAELGCGLLAVEADATRELSPLRDLAERLDCDVLVVR